ncbi:MAG: hypothetical protein ACK5H4_07610 [Lacrimispora sphenoides]
MLRIPDIYKSIVDTVLDENPVITLEKYLKDYTFITAGQLLQIHCKIANQWRHFQEYGVSSGVMLTDQEVEDSCISIYDYDFTDDITAAIQNSDYKSIFYIINLDGKIISREEKKEKLVVEKGVSISHSAKNILFFLGIKGVDIIISGMLSKSENFPNSYKDLIDASRQLSIHEYKKLLQDFYMKDVRHDPCKKYFVRTGDLPKTKRENTINKYHKLLRNKPEEIFQRSLISYFKDHCSDTVTKEVANNDNDRYDLFIETDSQEIYVIEIKWLGCSITPEYNIFSKYNNSERAIAGAYQLQHYVDNAEQYKEYLMEYPIRCGILLVFDAREVYDEIIFPPEIERYPNIDLSQIYKVEKKDISASNIYQAIKKGKGSTECTQ